jgi:regulation of enolase protein 1 (concanavalin A-like superfamily)
VTVTNAGASSVYTVNLDLANAGSDEFNGTGLGPQWQLVRPDAARVRVGGGRLVITAQSGDLQGNVNTARNLALQSVNGDWTAESKLVFSRPLTTNNEQGGVIAYANDNNYVKLAWEMSASTQPINKLRVVLLREQNGTATTIQVTGADAQRIVGADGAIWLRLAKSGGTYKAYYSTDGSVWRFMGSTTLNVEATQAGLVAFNRGGNTTDLDVAFDSFKIASVGEAVPVTTTAAGGAGASVPATLSLSLGASATFGAFTPGVTKDYTASTSATVTSSAGDAALSVSDPGRLMNGSFALPSPLAVSFSKSSWTGPTANEPVTIGFTQHIAATDALRTGSYSKTLTFTLSTTNP